MTRRIDGKIRVLQYIHTSAVTGPGRIVYGLSDKLNRDEFLCDVACPVSGALADDLRKLGTHIVAFEPEKLRSVPALMRMGITLVRGGYHVLHIHSGQHSALWKALGRLAGIPAIIYTEHVEGSGHEWIEGEFARKLHLWCHPIANMMVDMVIAVSEQTRAVYLQRQGMPRAKTTVIYNGVYADELKDHIADRQAMRGKLGISPEALLIGVVGRLVPEKGHRFFIIAAREIVRQRHDVKFIIVGEGPERSNIERMIEHNGLKDHFVLTGFLPDAYAVMDCIDIVVQPSVRSSESFGLTVVEAMAKSKPVVASDIGCFSEIIENGLDGLLFRSEDPDSLKDKIMLLLEDKALMDSIAAAACKKAAEKFDISITAKKTGCLYRKVLAKKGILTSDGQDMAVEDFLSLLKSENGLSTDEAEDHKADVLRYIDISAGEKLDATEAENYLNKEDNYIIESFLAYIKKEGLRRGGIEEANDNLFRSLIKNKPVTSRDYDERIKAQSLGFQIDNYYEPKYKSLKLRVDAVLESLDPAPGEAILDVGCGVGTFAFNSAKSGAKAYGADYSAASIDVAKKLAAHFGYDGKIEYSCCDVCGKLPYPDGFFDKIVAADFIEHIDRSEKVSLVAEMVRVLKPSGRIIVFTPNAIRERLGLVKAFIMRMFGSDSTETRLHYGLTDRFTFEKILHASGLTFTRRFIDVSRPYLAAIPFIREALSLDILWVIKR